MNRISTCSIALAVAAPTWSAPIGSMPAGRAPAAQEQEPAPRLVDERPSPMEVPRIPSLEIEGEPVAPTGRPLARNLALCQAADCRIAAPGGYLVLLDSNQAGFGADSCSSVCSLDASVTSTYYNAIKIIWFSSVRHI